MADLGNAYNAPTIENADCYRQLSYFCILSHFVLYVALSYYLLDCSTDVRHRPMSFGIMCLLNWFGLELVVDGSILANMLQQSSHKH
eukprot:1103863-Amphidinium_carterae.1